ncbi:MAG: ABC transporter ATP-binding protein [Ilumatobacteraceae bacterium]
MTDSSHDVVRLEGVRKLFGSFVAVHEADFAIANGEFFSVLGPSGCGKTTILRMIAGFEQPTEGRVMIEGIDVSSVPPHRRNVNTVFQQYALFPHMSVADNVAFGPRNKKLPEKEVASRVSEMLAVVRLSEFASRRPAQLSGGQQQRVALARALVNYPSALLLDEPLAALDLKLREAMQIELKRIQREVGITFVFVTHDQGEALTMSDRVAVMSAGRVEQIATPVDIYTRPASLFVAGFIGSANLLPATVASADSAGARVELTSGGSVTLAAGQMSEGSTFSVGDMVTVMVRPEHLAVTADRSSGEAIEARVTDVVFQGASVRVVARTTDGIEVAALVSGQAELPFLRPESTVWLGWKSGVAYGLPGRPDVAGATTTNVDHVEAGL